MSVRRQRRSLATRALATRALATRALATHALATRALAACALAACGDPEAEGGERGWLTRWGSEVIIAGERECPPLALPRPRYAPLGGALRPYYGERLRLEWRARPYSLREGAWGAWGAWEGRGAYPLEREGVWEVSARAVGVVEGAGGEGGEGEEGDEGWAGPLPPLSGACLRALVGQEARRELLVTASFPGGAEDPARGALTAEDPRVIGWAEEVTALTLGEGLAEGAARPEEALGVAEGHPVRALSLGEGGRVTLRLSTPAADTPGADLGVFENSFNHTFLELGFVEVSSDGHTFARLPSAYLGEERLGPFGEQPPEQISGLAGSTQGGAAEGLDLASLAGHPAVEMGLINPQEINYIRVVDIIGDGRAHDTLSRPIYDPYPTALSAGFDLDGVCALGPTR